MHGFRQFFEYLDDFSTDAPPTTAFDRNHIVTQMADLHKAIIQLDPFLGQRLGGAVFGTTGFISPEGLKDTNFDSDHLTDLYQKLRKQEPRLAILLEPAVMAFRNFYQSYMRFFGNQPDQKPIGEANELSSRLDLRIVRQIAHAVDTINSVLNTMDKSEIPVYSQSAFTKMVANFKVFYQQWSRVLPRFQYEISQAHKSLAGQNWDKTIRR